MTTTIVFFLLEAEKEENARLSRFSDAILMSRPCYFYTKYENPM